MPKRRAKSPASDKPPALPDELRFQIICKRAGRDLETVKSPAAYLRGWDAVANSRSVKK